MKTWQLIYSPVDGSSNFSLFWPVLQQTLSYITWVQYLPWVHSKQQKGWAVGYTHLLLNTVPVCSLSGSQQFTLPIGSVWYLMASHTHQQSVVSAILLLAILMGMKYLTVFSFVFPLINSQVEYLSIYLSALYRCILQNVS